MDLLSSPLASDVLEKIRTKHGVGAAEDHSALDRFFWLRARRESDGRLRIDRAHRADDTDGQDTPSVRLCNLVLQGGGTLGLAHAGFVTGLEAAGVRFAGLAGTSAGSILAMGIAAIRGDDILKETSRDLVDITDAVPMDSFIDGPRPVRIIIKRALQGRRLYSPQFWPGLLSTLFRLRDRRGLNHGTAFETWFESVMRAQGWNKIDDLYADLDRVWTDLADLRGMISDISDEPILKNPALLGPALVERPGASLLQLISMAMPVGVKFKLPQDLYYLSAEYAQTSPARLVRTSMSIPAFFEPVTMRTNPQTWPQRIASEVSDLISADQSEQFSSLEELVFLDGGMMSNLPSDSFRDMMPEVPTIVVPLVQGNKSQAITRRSTFSDLASDAAACASAVRLQRDRETWAQNTLLRAEFDRNERATPEVTSGTRPARRYPVAIAPVDTGAANWLNFVMSTEDKAALFEAGLIRAHDLLETLSNEGEP